MAGENRPSNVNERTYQEVDYLKKNLGPVLVAALAEICIRRPADPIEYLGHWLLRWRYNEELKRRDVQNALEVVHQKQWESAQAGVAAPDFTQGVTPAYPNLPPGYGGPLMAEEEGEATEEPRTPPAEQPVMMEQPGELEGEDQIIAPPTARKTVIDEGKRKSSGSSGATQEKRVSGASGKRTSDNPEEQTRVSVSGKRTSDNPEEQQRGSRGSNSKRASGGIEENRTSMGGDAEERRQQSLKDEAQVLNVVREEGRKSTDSNGEKRTSLKGEKRVSNPGAEGQ